MEAPSLIEQVKESLKEDKNPKTIKLRQKYLKLLRQEDFLIANPKDKGWEHWERLMDQQMSLIEEIQKELHKEQEEKKRLHEQEMKNRQQYVWPVRY